MVTNTHGIYITPTETPYSLILSYPYPVTHFQQYYPYHKSIDYVGTLRTFHFDSKISRGKLLVQSTVHV